MSDNRFINTGILYFLDTIIMATTGWIYWIVVSKFTLTSEIGQATIVFSLVTTIAVLTQLGLEYPLLKESSHNRSKILGTTIIIELTITTISIPFILYVMNFVYGKSLHGFDSITIVMLFLYQIGFVLRSLLLGISAVKKVLFVDVIGNALRFASGCVLVIMGFGALGIILSFLLQYLVVAAVMFVIIKKSFDLKLGSFQYTKDIIRDGLINTPAKLSRLFIISLSIVLLGSFGIRSSAIGVFYIALNISLMAGGFASSIAYMSIPASSISKTDLSSKSLRIGLSLTSPLIVALLIAPKQILALIGPEYSSAATVLMILAVSILPYSIVMNTISKFNNLHKSKELVIIGSLQILTFLIAFWLLVPQYETLGAAFAFLIGFAISAIPSMLWSERILIRSVFIPSISIVAGGLAGYTLNYIIGLNIILTVLVSIIVTISVVLGLRSTSIAEIVQILEGIIRKDNVNK